MTNTQNDRQTPPTFAEMLELEKELKATQTGEVPQKTVTLSSTDPHEPTLTPEEETYKKRFSDASRTIQQNLDRQRAMEAEIEQLRQAKADAEAKASVKPSNVTDAKIDEFKAQYPDAMEVIEEVINRRAKEMSQHEVNALKQEFTKDKQVNEKKLADKAKLQETYPNYKDFEKSDSPFIEWLGKQSATIQRLAVYENTGDIDAVISVLDMFTAQVQVKRPSGQTRQAPLTANPVTNSPVEIPVPQGKFDLAKWDKAMDTAQKKGDRKAMDKLMEDFNAAGGMALFKQQN